MISKAPLSGTRAHYAPPIFCILISSHVGAHPFRFSRGMFIARLVLPTGHPYLQ